MRVIYGGPLDGVELTVPDGRTVVALRGEVIDVPAEFGESLTSRTSGTRRRPAARGPLP